MGCATGVLQRVSICVNLELTAVVGALKANHMRETADRTALILPCRGSHSRDAVFFQNLGFVDL